MTPHPHGRRASRALLLLALCLGVPPTARDARAGDAAPEGGEEDVAEQVERHVTRGLAAFRRGNHEEALARMERLAKVDPKHPLPRVLRARILARTGRYAEALALASEAVTAAPGDRRAAALRFDMLRRLGRDDEALTAVAAALAANPEDVVARTVRGTLLAERGRRAEALAEFDHVVDAYNARELAAEDLPFVATAAIQATRLSPNPADDMLQGAVKLLGARVEADPADVDAKLALADLWQSYRGPDGQSKAGRFYKEILDANPEIAEARVGQARIALVFYDQTGAAQACRRALSTDPNLVPAMNVLARIHVGDGDYVKADEMWERAQKVNPRDRESRSVRAARLHIAGDRAGFEAIEKALLGEDPSYGRLYATVSDLVGERQRRYDLAAELSAKAIEVDPADDQALVVHGVNLMNLGREDDARKSFDRAVEVAKGYKDVIRDNFREVLDALETFVESKSEHFVLRQHPSEAAVMEAYLLPLLERAWTDLSAKYGIRPTGPVLVESFHRHDDFSARSVGAPNIPALGVCFGRVITLDGPLSRGLGEFSWARTAWHEFAHVVTLEMSRGQVPRWLTEGLSVHEEKAHKAEWGREMDRELFDRWKNGRLLKMADINHAFRGPDVMFAYFQGGLIADLIAKDWGFEAITAMLKRFADDVPTEKVFEEVLKVPLADFDRRLEAYVATLVGGFRMVPRWDEESRKALEARTKEKPDDAAAWTRLGFAYLQRGAMIDAGAALAKAKPLAPDAPDTILLEGELAMRSKRKDLAKTHFERFLAAGGDDVSARTALARIALEENRSEDAVTQFEAAKACFPRQTGKGSPYLELARLYEGAGRMEDAVRELEAYAAIAQEDYGVRRKLAGWYESKKDDESILRVSEEMIEISPFGAPKGKPPDLDLHRRYAEALVRAGRKPEAVREWRVQTLLLDMLPEAGRLKAGAVDVRLALGELLLELGSPEEALEQALAALALDPDSNAAKILKARAQGGGNPR